MEVAVRSMRRKKATGTCCRFDTGLALEIAEAEEVQNFLNIASVGAIIGLDIGVAFTSVVRNLEEAVPATQVDHMLAIRGCLCLSVIELVVLTSEVGLVQEVRQVLLPFASERPFESCCRLELFKKLDVGCCLQVSQTGRLTAPSPPSHARSLPLALVSSSLVGPGRQFCCYLG